MTSQKAIKAHAREAARADEHIAKSEGDSLQLKTGTMLKLERIYKMDIRDMLRPQLRGCDIFKALNISESTVSKWRKRFNITITHHSGQYTKTGRKGRH